MNQTPMKHCPRCDRDKPITEFWRRSKGSDARQSWCKPCDLESSRQSRQRHIVTRRDKEREVARGRPQPTYTPEQHEHRKELWREQAKEHADRARAGHEVREAVKRGERLLRGELRVTERTGRIMYKPDHCRICKCRCCPEPHHCLGYARAHWFDVVWLCRDCHRQGGICERECEALGLPRTMGMSRFIARRAVETEALSSPSSFQVYNVHEADSYQPGTEMEKNNARDIA